MKKYLLGLLALVGAFGSHAWATASTSSVGIDQNALRMWIGNGGVLDVETGGDITFGAQSLGLSYIHFAKATYNFATNGGGNGTSSLGVTIPAGSLIIGGYVDTITTVQGVSTGSTLGFGAESGADLLAAHTVGSSYFTPGTPRTLVPAFTSASVKTTVPRTLNSVIGVSGLSAGKVNLFIEYYISQ